MPTKREELLARRAALRKEIAAVYGKPDLNQATERELRYELDRVEAELGEDKEADKT